MLPLSRSGFWLAATLCSNEVPIAMKHRANVAFLHSAVELSSVLINAFQLWVSSTRGTQARALISSLLLHFFTCLGQGHTYHGAQMEDRGQLGVVVSPHMGAQGPHVVIMRGGSCLFNHQTISRAQDLYFGVLLTVSEPVSSCTQLW